MSDQIRISDTGELEAEPTTWDGEPLYSPATVAEGLFDPDAFKQMRGQMSYAQAHPTFVANYMDEAAARIHAQEVGGSVEYVWASGIDTWEVRR